MLMAVAIAVPMTMLSAFSPMLSGTAAATETPTTTEAPPRTTQLAYPEGSDTIIGTPEAGPKPQNSGDRGGWAQLVTLAMIVGAVLFIVWRIRASSIRGRASTA